MTLSRTAAFVFGAAMLCGVGASAQSGTVEQREKTKVDVKDGKSVTLVGCVARSAGDSHYVLTDEHGTLKYALVTDDDLSKYVDHRVEVKGNAADRGDGKVKIEHRATGTTGEKSSAVELKGKDADLPFLGLKSIKTLNTSCR